MASRAAVPPGPADGDRDDLAAVFALDDRDRRGLVLADVLEAVDQVGRFRWQSAATIPTSAGTGAGATPALHRCILPLGSTKFSRPT